MRARQIHTVDPTNGALIWKAEGRHDATGGVTGAPVLYEDRIIVPVSSSGVGPAPIRNTNAAKATAPWSRSTRRPGSKLWTAHTMEDAKYTGKTSPAGVKQRGPSGAPIWSTPSIDARRGLVYAGTGQATSLPATNTSDAVLALDLASGELRWSFQALARDVWHLGCQFDPKKSGPNCPGPDDSVLKDYDFGAGIVVSRRPDGRDVLLAGQKSGDLWALDPQQAGKVLWHERFGTGSPLGGIHWGLATDGQRVFAPINDPHFAESPGYVPRAGHERRRHRQRQSRLAQTGHAGLQRRARAALCRLRRKVWPVGRAADRRQLGRRGRARRTHLHL